MTRPVFGRQPRGCTYQVEDNPDNAPRYCGKPVVAIWLRWTGPKRARRHVEYPRCVRHDDTMDRAVGLREDYSRIAVEG